MAGRWRDPSAFRADPAATPSARPSRRQTLALLAVVLVVAGAVAAASYAVRPEKARAFQLFHGSLFLADEQSPVAVDLASGKPTLRLVGADKQVGISGNDTLGVIPLDGPTLLLNRTTGEFNMVDSSGFVVKHDGGGVPLGKASGTTSAIGVADGELAYIVRNSDTRTDVFLVSQATVQSAMFATATVKPRASRAMSDGAADTGPGGAVSADGALWVLVAKGGADQHTIRRLSVPAGSSAGAVLSSSDHGSVTGPAAMGTASDGSATAVGVATADRIRIFTGHSTRTVHFAAPAGVDQILPATNRSDRLSYLMHGTDGWSRVSVAADGSDLRAPRAIAGLPAAAKLVQPAYSANALYTMDQDGGQIYRIDSDSRAGAIAGAERYPVSKFDGADAEQALFPDAAVVARESRVVFNSATHANALIIFTDGSHPPQTIEKSSAVSVSASGGAEQLTRSTVNPGPEPGKAPTDNGTKPKPAPGQLVNNKIDCKTVSQKPHIPRIDQVQTGSRSVTLAWTYPIIDKTQDCYPSTYVVGVKLLSNGAPQPPSQVTVQSQAGATITGLFPLTRYELTVTAYINGQSTSSQSIQVQTGPEGPAAPTALTVAADSSGNWILDWSSCGTVQQGCVPAESWTVTPSFCDGRGLSAPPAPITSTADPTARRQPTVRYPGSDDLLGRGLQFVVTGSGQSQVPGTPSAKSPCVYSWSPPVASDIHLTASTPPKTSSAAETTTTTASVTFDHGDVHDLGGVGGTLTYHLLHNGAVVDTVGPTSATTVTLHGIRAGLDYQVNVVAAPPRHSSAAVTVGPVDVVHAVAAWPAVAVAVDQSTGVKNDGSLAANVTFQLSGVSSAAADGERFDVSWVLICGEYQSDVKSRTGVDPADPITFAMSRLDASGSCTVKVKRLSESGGSGIFGGTPAPDVPASNAFNIDQPTLTGVSQSDFTASWDGSSGGQSLVAINYTGGNPVLGLLAQWSVSVSDPTGAACGGYTGSGSLHDVAIDQGCVDRSGATGKGWQVAVSVRSIGGQTQGPFLLNQINGGAAPTYNPPQCDINKAGFGATWAGSSDAPAIKVDANDSGAIKDCSGWGYAVSGPTTQDCGKESGAPPQTIAVTCTDDRTAAGWSVTVTYTDPGGTSQTYAITSVDGTPP